jgi:pimeloyl-ACP methyl ester carboxylesterase
MLAPLAAGSALVLALAGCVAGRQQLTPDASSAPASSAGSGPDASAPTDLDALYSQQLSWRECGDFECTDATAPLDWEDPSAGTISLALIRQPATDTEDRLGSLLVNPGGPGASTVDSFDYLAGQVGKDVAARYDIVGFDPRGVGSSTAVSCGPDDQVDAYLTADVTITSQADLDAASARATAFGQECQKGTGALLAHVDTVSAARDMDLLRAVLGDDQLHYLGYSYGTFLGATYAGLFPDKVGRLVLDGALDPSLDNDRLVLEQAKGFEQALRSYVTYCQKTKGCPLTGSVDDGLAQIKAMVDGARERPLRTSFETKVNGTLAYLGVVVTLYADQSWPYLTQALAEAMTSQTGNLLLQFADQYLDREEPGTYTSNSNLAFQAVNCLDYPATARDYDQMVAFRDEVAKVAPTFADSFAMVPGCETWPVQSTRTPAPVHASGAAPILVVGTTGDPATPYAWAQALADQLDSGRLLTWQGEGHTAYGRSGACIGDAVDAYFLDGTLPAEGTTCD